MTDDVIKKIPELLEHPMIIMESNSVPGRLVIYGDVSSDKGPVMTALELNPTNRGYIVDNLIKVASAYTRNNTQNYINKCNILWVYDNKNMTSDWLRRTGLQLPVGINQYGLISKITPTQGDVNSSFVKKTNNSYKDNIYVYSNRMNKVEKGMKDEERAKVLSKTHITVPECKINLTENEKNNLKRTVPFKLEFFYKLLGNKFGIYKKYKDGNIEWNFSKRTVAESANKEEQVHDNSYRMVQMISCAEDIINNAVPISIHDDLYNGTLREDTTLQNTYVMISAYSAGDEIIPVEIIAKERKENNTIRMIVSLNEIEADDFSTRSGTKAEQNAPRSASDEISVADIISHVNNEDGSFLKYIPDSMLSDTQVTSARESLMIQYAKQELLADDIRPDNKTISDYLELHRDEMLERAYEVFPKRDSETDNNQYSYRDKRSNREILADALMSATKTRLERESLEYYQQKNYTTVEAVLDLKSGARLRVVRVYIKNKASQVGNVSTQRGYTVNDMTKVASAYTKNNANNQINKSKIHWLYDNKNMTINWLRRTGLQLPVQPHQYGLI